MARAADEPRDTGDSAFDRFLRFGTALFSVEKGELPKRDGKRGKKPSGEKPNPAPGA